MNLDHLLTEEFVQARSVITSAAAARVAHRDYQADKRINGFQDAYEMVERTSRLNELEVSI